MAKFRGDQIVIQDIADDVTLTTKYVQQTNFNPASETVAGVIELATQAEVDAGSDALRAITPATLAAWPGGGGGGLANIVEDLTPQLGGNLDVNSNNLFTPNTSGASADDIRLLAGSDSTGDGASIVLQHGNGSNPSLPSGQNNAIVIQSAANGPIGFMRAEAGNFDIFTGTAESAAGTAGITISSGTATTTGKPGDINIIAGAGEDVNNGNPGGSINITAGDHADGSNGNNGGRIILTAGLSAGYPGPPSSVDIKGSSGAPGFLRVFSDGGGYSAVVSPGAFAGGTFFVLPPTNGNSGEVLTNTGGNTVWAAPISPIAPTYTLGTLPSQSTGAMIYVSDATGASLTGSQCFSNGTVWIDVTTGAAVA